MNPVRSLLHYPAVTLTLIAITVLVGIHAILEMPRREDPKITIRTGLVIALYPGATVEQVEQQVTRRLEQRLFRFAEVRKKKTYSTTRNGLVVINVELEEWVKGPDAFWSKLRHDLNELKVRELPSGVQGPIVDSDFGDTVAQLLAVSGNRYGYRELKSYLDRVEDRLRTVPGVSKIKRYGEQPEEILLTTSTERLAPYNLKPQDVRNVLQAQNLVVSAGSVDVDQTEVPLQPTALFQTEDQIRRLVVALSPQGEPIYLGDVAQVERRYQDPAFLTRTQGEACVLLSLEMQEGNNIVTFGRNIHAAMESLREELPPDLRMELVADQPTVVRERVMHFGREFGIAIISVILVTMLLLPLRVAAIAAIAIPVTIAITFALMEAFGIELHQVSIAALIVVLGMVVDDAIVIADNYVELLDHGVARPEAAWRSAGDLAVPVLTATLTIIASFLPLAFLTGTVGEFIRALPLTVTIALLASYVIAMVLTPLTCKLLISKGLHAAPVTEAHGGEAGPHERAVPVTKKRRPSPLDLMQSLYDIVLGWTMKRRTLTLAFAAVSFVIGLFLISQTPNRFFPPAERDQFVVDVWLPEGTRIEATDEAVRRLERELRGTHGIHQVASFIGQGAPRFYYNVSPEAPAANYAQLLVRSESPEATTELVPELRSRLQRLVPEALVIVKELEQGPVTNAPVEVRIVGYDLGVLEATGRRVLTLLEENPGSTFTTTDYKNHSLRLALDVDSEQSSRLGFTKANLAQELGGISGTTVSTFWEGSRSINIVTRVDEAHRETFEDVARLHVASSITGQRVPVFEVASPRPEWGPGRLVRRNGVRTLTVRAFPRHGYLASQLLAEVRPRIETIQLPQGYRVEYGGEYENQGETFREMLKALAVSQLLIFLILMLQFRSLANPLIVMTAIPLSFVGCGLGLILTGNPFSFSAFLGLISLTGVVVRNAIMLVDYMNEERRKGVAVERAAMDAGRRRLRPIFLTSAAAAVGVLPMILSGSGMWGPLASVIAVGLLCSMVFTLIVVPILYVVVHGREEREARPASGPGLLRPIRAGLARTAARFRRTAAAVLILGLLISGAEPVRAEPEVVSLTLEQAVTTALAHNHQLRALRSSVDESDFKVRSASASYLPEVRLEAVYTGTTDNKEMTVPKGSLGTVPDVGRFPTEDVHIAQSGGSVFVGAATLSQPLTPLYKVNQAHTSAVAERRAAEAVLQQATDETTIAVHRAYFTLLVTMRQREAAWLQGEAASIRASDAATAVLTGNAMRATELEGKAAALEARQRVQALDDQIADLEGSLAQLLGMPTGTRFDPAVPNQLPSTSLPSLDASVAAAVAKNPEVIAAEQKVIQSNAAVGTANAAYVPDLYVFARFSYQDGLDKLPGDDLSFGVRAEWTVFDFGKRESTIDQRRSGRESARAKLEGTKSRIALETAKAWRAVDRARRSVELAEEVHALRAESARVRGDESEIGIVLAVAQKESVAALATADAERLNAHLNLWVAKLDLERWTGGTTVMP